MADATPKSKEKLAFEAFSDRLRERDEALQKSHSTPDGLKDLISPEDFRAIYKYILDPENIKKIEPAVIGGQKFYRLPKKKTGLSHTLNIAFEPLNGEMVLFLETKSNILDPFDPENPHLMKDPNAKKFMGTNKTTKIAHRIDVDPPIKWGNSVIYIRDPEEQQVFYKETILAQKLDPAFRLPSVRGTPIMPERVPNSPLPKRKGPGGIESRFQLKMSYYTPFAEQGDLESFIRKKGHTLTAAQKNDLTKQLLKIAESLQKKGIVHQDLKPANFLVYLDEHNEYRIKPIDFGEAFDPTYKVSEGFAKQFPELAMKVTHPRASAPTGYHSPEIAAAILTIPEPKPEDDLDKKDYLTHTTEKYSGIPRSHGQDFVTAEMCAKATEYDKPNSANDMWAIGIVLYQLNHDGDFPTKDSTDFTPVIAGLLEPDRAQRLTAGQALLVHNVASATTETGYKQAIEALAQEKENLPPTTKEFLIKQMKFIQFVEILNGNHTKNIATKAKKLHNIFHATPKLSPKDKFYNNLSITQYLEKHMPSSIENLPSFLGTEIPSPFLPKSSKQYAPLKIHIQESSHNKGDTPLVIHKHPTPKSRI